MRIHTLAENTACRPGLTAEHGLSLFIETGSHKILFDTGQSAAFAENAARMGIDLAEADFAVVSHGHYDHGGGLARFLEINPTAPVYVNQNAFEPHYNAAGSSIGLDPALAASRRLIFTEDDFQIAPGIHLHTCNGLPRPYPTDPFGLTVLENGGLRPDPFRHEQYLLIEAGGTRFLFSGCSHKGILNIVSWFRPHVLVGGFHFKPLDPIRDAHRLEQAAGLLLESPTVYYTGHCTGAGQFDFLKARMGSRLHALSTGRTIEL